MSLSCNDYKLSPKAASTKVSVVLNTQPTTTVKVKLKQSKIDMFDIPQDEIEFTPENWNVPQDIAISFSKFNETTAAITNLCVYATVISEEAIYQDIESRRTCFDVYRHDAIEYSYSSKEEKVTLLPGEYEVEVWGAQGEGSQNGGGGGGGSGHIGADITDGEMIDGSGNYEFPSPIEGTELGHPGTGNARITIIERPRVIAN